VRERGGKDLGKIALGIPPPLCPSARRQGEEEWEREEDAERERGWSARALPLVRLQRRKKRRRKERGARVVWSKFK
jgi:hypothetical protein